MFIEDMMALSIIIISLGLLLIINVVGCLLIGKSMGITPIINAMCFTYALQSGYNCWRILHLMKLLAPLWKSMEINIRESIGQ